MGDLVFLGVVGVFVCLVFALEPLWGAIYRWAHRNDPIEHPLGKTRLGK